MVEFLNDELKTFKAFQIVIAAICILIPPILRCNDNDKFYPQKLSLNTFDSIKNREVNIRIDTIAKLYKNRHEDSFIVTAYPVRPDAPVVQIIAIGTLRKDPCGFRESLSHYALSSNSWLFGMLYTMAALMFIYNGVVHWKMKTAIAQQGNTKRLKLMSSETKYNLIIGSSLILVILNPLDTHPTSHITPHIVFSVLFFVANLTMIVFYPNKYESRLPLRVRIILMIMFAAVMAFLALIEVISVLYVEWITLTFIAIHLILIAIEVNDNIKKYKKS